MTYTLRNTIILKLLVQVSDMLLLNVICLFFIFLFENDPLTAHAVPYWVLVNVSYLISLNIVTVILYNRITKPEEVISRVGKTLIVHAILFLAALSLFHIESPPIIRLGFFYGILFCVISIERLIMRSCIKHFRNDGRDSRTAVLIGEGPNLMEIAEMMCNAWYGYRLMGVFSDEEELTGFPPMVQKIDKINQTIQWLSSHKVDEVYCGLSSDRANDILLIINHCENNLIHFYTVPSLRNYLKRELSPVKFGNITIFAIREEPLNLWLNRMMKRSFDLVLSSLFLGTVYPVMLVVVGIAVKCSSPGSVYFRQERTGIDGKTFRCIKFRSMKENGASDILQATKDDPRKTKLGDFLRRTNIDEFPQFINVWKGEMSIVGPRPHMLKHTEEYSQLINRYMVRHLVKPGITGWAQVNGCRGETKHLAEMKDRVKHDIWYLENWTFWLDIRITARTFTNMLQGEKNAY
jgi:putative colanic acid biosynthesis UDP-glucose lipid carrier transferase